MYGQTDHGHMQGDGDGDGDGDGGQDSLWQVHNTWIQHCVSVGNIVYQPDIPSHISHFWALNMHELNDKFSLQFDKLQINQKWGEMMTF